MKEKTRHKTKAGVESEIQTISEYLKEQIEQVARWIESVIEEPMIIPLEFEKRHGRESPESIK